MVCVAEILFSPLYRDLEIKPEYTFKDDKEILTLAVEYAALMYILELDRMCQK